MDQLIRLFPSQLQEALGIARAARLTPSAAPIRQVVLAGLGGSAFSGEVIRNLVEDRGSLPFLISREYSLPHWVDQHTLVIISSYSGNTEETLSAFQDARARGAKIICVSSGGGVIQIAKDMGIDHIQLPAGSPPRAAAGYSLVQLLGILQHFGVLPDATADLEEGIGLLTAFQDDDLAREIAARLTGRIPILYSSGGLESASIRWRQQIEENAKQLAFHHVVPEMNHNELVGWKLPADLLSRTAVILLRSSLEHPRVAFRFGVNQGIIAKCTDCITEVHAKGRSRLAQLLYLIHLGDWVSCHLANANGVDATPVEVIDYLKETLSKLD